MIKGLHITNGSIFSDDNSNFGYEEFIALLEENGCRILQPLLS